MNEVFINIISARLKSMEENISNRIQSLEVRMSVIESLEENKNQLQDGIVIHERDSVKEEKGFTRDQNERLSTSSSISNIKRSWAYYILCTAVYILCFASSAFYIKAAYDKWQESPVVTAISNNHHLRLKDIPFPAITLCWPDRLKSDYNLEQNINDCLDCKNDVCKFKSENCSKEELTTLAFADQMCIKDLKLPEWIWEEGHVLKGIDGKELSSYMEELLPKCDTVGFLGLHTDTSFVGITPCDNTFQHFLSVSPDRICMTFNSLRHSDIYKDNVITPLPLTDQSNINVTGNPIWSYDNMFTDFKGSNESSPYYDYYSVSINLLLRGETSSEQMCKYHKDGIATLMVHSPNEIPFDPDSALKVPVQENKFLTVNLEPKITLAREDLKRYTPQQRGCFFSNENNLAMFKFYSKANCELECLMNEFVRRHDCVPFYFPRPNSTVKVCTQDLIEPIGYCGCLPDCNSISYEIKTEEQTERKANTPGHRRAPVTIKFTRTSLFYSDVRYSINSLAEFLAFSLGILGGFLGVSVTCVWHLLYSEVKKLPYSVNTWRRKEIPTQNQN